MNMEFDPRNKVKHIVIAGGGTAGWMTACALSQQLGHAIKITLVESEEIGVVGVGEATIPTITAFHQLIGLDEKEFIRETQATFKLGIQFHNWGNIGDVYFHAFGETGKEFWAGQFQHFWLRGLREGISFPYSDYSLECLAAGADKFAVTRNPRLQYAYHLDAVRYAKYLRRISEKNGVTRIEGKIRRVELDSAEGFIRALHLEGGSQIEADFFVDCTGFRGLLISQALHVSYEEWNDIFLCDRAVAFQTESTDDFPPYTRATAHKYGWQWRIPLQHRAGNGLVFSSKFISTDEAIQILTDNTVGARLNEPRIITFTPGKRRKIWHKNCVAIGLSSGFIEPLESTSIHLISSSIVRMMRMFPFGGIRETDIEEFNRQAFLELEYVRDFVALHYKVTQRSDTEFWNYCRNMQVPETLARRIDIYRETGRIFWSEDELFTTNSWNQVMLGQGLVPKEYHRAVDVMSQQELANFLLGYRATVQGILQKLPSHKEFMQAYVGLGDMAK